METLDSAIRPYQSKFTFWKVKANKNFQKNYQNFSNKFEPPINLAQIQKQFYFQEF
jgi:hypothetical protein